MRQMINNNQHTSHNADQSYPNKGYQHAQGYYPPNSGNGNPYTNSNQSMNYNGLMGQNGSNYGQGNKY
jgi:hypothetical protein